MAEKQKKFTQEQIDAINNYGNSITSLESFTEMVRKKPGMYLGPIGNDGYINMNREILQNCFDQVIIENAIANRIRVTIDELTKQVIYEDNGFGIPFDKMYNTFTKQHTSSHFTPKPYVFTAGTHGVGSKVVNAMSSKYIVYSYIFGEGRKLEFTEGIPDTKDIVKVPKKEAEGKQGTVVMFSPAFAELEKEEKITVTHVELLQLIYSILPLYPIGTSVELNWIDVQRKASKLLIVNDNGLKSYLNCKMPILKDDIIISSISPEVKMDVLFNFNAESISNIDCYANYCPTRSGTHLDGFIIAVSNWFRKMANDFFAKGPVNTKNSKGKDNKKKQTLIEAADVKTALCGIVHGCSNNPNFTGQAKENLSNKDVKTFIINEINKGLEDWAAKNPTELQKIFKFLKTLADIRTKQDSDRAKISTKYNSVLTGYPAKFTKPTGPKSQWEGVYFVEGDSAEGTAKFARIKACQGIMPLRGKIPNAFTHTRDYMLNNTECSAILNIVGGGEGKNFDLSKVPWQVIASLTDADVDGAHIAVLFLMFMLVYCRPAVEEGLVYKAQPPLYGVKKHNKQLFFGNQLEMTKYNQKEFLRENVICDVNGNKLSHVELLGLLIKNDEYIYELERLANGIAVNPYLLENVLINRELSSNKLAKELRKDDRFRFVKDVKDINKHLFVQGLVDKQDSTLFLTDAIINQSSEVITRLDETFSEFRNPYFLLNGKLSSLYEVMRSYEKYKPSNVSRYKGLGEMSAKMLRESTMDPDGPRCMIQYTAKDIINEVEELRYLSSNLNLIKLEGKVRRSDLLD